MRPYPRQRNAVVTGVAATAATLFLAAGTSLPAAATSAVAAPAHPAGAAAAHPAGAAAARTVLLANGDRLVVRPAPDGRHAIALQPAPGSGPLFSLSEGSLDEIVPAYALPYLGHGLDASLFDLGPLLSAETGGDLPVQVRFTDRKPALPGVTITRWGQGLGTGYLTPWSARIFGSALERQARADYARASYGADGMFAGGVEIALAGAAAPAARARPDFPMHLLNVTASNLQDKPATGGLVTVINADDWRTFGDPNEVYNAFYHGTARYSVPAGHYWAIADFANNTFTSQRLVVLPQFTVQGRITTVHISERAASSRVTMVTPRPAALQLVTLNIVRGGLSGTSASYQAIGFGGPLWVSPTTRKPNVGTLRTYTSAQLTSPARAAGTPYAYNVAYAGPAGVIPGQHFDVSAAGLATVNESYYQDVRSTGAWMTFGGFPAVSGGVAALVAPLRLPGRQVQYMSAGPAIVWSSSYFEFRNSFLASGQNDTFRTYRAGQQLTEDWNQYPLHPQPDVQLLRGGAARLDPQYPSAFRLGDALWLDPIPFGDNQPGHTGAGLSPAPGVRLTGSYAIYQDGVRIAQGNPANNIPPVNVTREPATIRFVLSAGRWSKSFPESPASQTVWTWRSARQPAATVPPGWFCGYVDVGGQVKPMRRCSVQPLLTLDYHVRALALNGTTPTGPQVIDLSVSHQQPAKAAPITGASVQVSYNDGQTWQPATLTSPGGGNFRITFTAPAGVDPTLRVSATDAAGGSITETIIRAYGVAS